MPEALSDSSLNRCTEHRSVICKYSSPAGGAKIWITLIAKRDVDLAIRGTSQTARPRLRTLPWQGRMRPELLRSGGSHAAAPASRSLDYTRRDRKRGRSTTRSIKPLGHCRADPSACPRWLRSKWGKVSAFPLVLRCSQRHAPSALLGRRVAGGQHSLHTLDGKCGAERPLAPKRAARGWPLIAAKLAVDIQYAAQNGPGSML
jgi:hypothetical protein